MPNMPVPCCKETLLALLDDIRHHVEHNDSFEGFVEYTMPIGGDDQVIEDADFLLRASYRIGNSQGQGGMRMIGKTE